MTKDQYKFVYVDGQPMIVIEPFYVNPDTLETSRTPREGFELHPAFRTLREIRDGIDWGEY